MQRKATRPAAAGAIIGRGKMPPDWDGRQSGIMLEALRALTGTHQMQVVANWPSFTILGPLPFGQESNEMYSGRHAALLRIVVGQAVLHTAGGQHSLAYPDWAYIPPRSTYRLTNTVNDGSGLTFGVMRVRRKWLL